MLLRLWQHQQRCQSREAGDQNVIDAAHDRSSKITGALQLSSCVMLARNGSSSLKLFWCRVRVQIRQMDPELYCVLLLAQMRNGKLQVATNYPDVGSQFVSSELSLRFSNCTSEANVFHQNEVRTTSPRKSLLTFYFLWKYLCCVALHCDHQNKDKPDNSPVNKVRNIIYCC